MPIRTVLALLSAATLLGLVLGPPAGAVAAPLPAHTVVVNPDPADTTANVMDGNTQAVVDLGARVIVGGNFTTVKRWNRPAPFARHAIAAYDKATGAIDPAFAPQLDGQVTAMLDAGHGRVFVAGQFKHVDGAGAPFLVRLSATTGALDPTFVPRPSGMVYDIRLVGPTLYLGGTFTKVGNVARANFAAVDATSGAVLPIAVGFASAAVGLTRVMRMAVSPDGRSLVAVGNFTTVGGRLRPNIAKLDLLGRASATVDPWTTDVYRSGTCSSVYDTAVRDVAFAPDGSYFVVVTTGSWGGTGSLCDAVARWESNVGDIGDVGDGLAQPTWSDATGGDTIGSVAATGAAVYSCGHFRWANNNLPAQGDTAGPGAVTRQGIAAIDPATGVPLAWNPGRERGLSCWRLTPTAAGLYVMSDSVVFGTEWHPRLTYVGTAGGRVPVTSTAARLPVTLRYGGSTTAAGSPDLLHLRRYDGLTLGPEATAPSAERWSQVAGVVTASNRLFRFRKDGVVQASTYGNTWTTLPEWITLTGLSALAFGSQGAGTTNAGQLVYTRTGDPHLYARGFSADSGTISTLVHTVSGDGDGLSWADVRGLAVIGDQLYHAHADGTLRRTDLARGAPVAATTVVLSGPAVDGLDWARTSGLHTTPSSGAAAAAPAVAPVAAVVSTPPATGRSPVPRPSTRSTTPSGRVGPVDHGPGHR